MGAVDRPVRAVRGRPDRSVRGRARSGSSCSPPARHSRSPGEPQGEGVGGPLGRLHHLGVDVPRDRGRRSRRSRRCSRSRRASSRRARSWPLVVGARGGTMRVSRRALVSCALIGCLLPGANAVLFYAEQDVPTGLASLLIAVGPALGRRAAAVPAASACRRRRSSGSGVGFAGVADPRSSPRGRDRRRDRALRALRRDVGASGRSPPPRLHDARRPVRRNGVGDARSAGFVMLPIGLATAGIVLAVDLVDPGVDLPRDLRLASSATRRTRGCSRTPRSGSSRPTRTSTRSWRSCSGSSSATSS